MKRFLTILLLSFITFSSVYAQQIDVEVIIVPPYSNQLDDYFHDLDKTIITLTNTGNNSANVNLKFDLFRNGNPFASVKPEYKITQPIVLAPQEIKILTGSALDDAFSAFSLDNMDHTLTDKEQFNLNVYKILPEGYYDLCVKAYDYVTDRILSPEGGGRGCAGFTIQDGIPAEIIDPIDDSQIPNLDNGISWSPAISDILPTIEYQLEIRDVTGLPISKKDASIMTQLLIFQKTLNDVFYDYNFDGSDPELLKNHTYQIDLISKDVANQIKFKNNGHSQSVRFTIKKSIPPGGINLEVAYPLTADTLPFEYISTIVKHSPYSDNYTKFDFKYILKDTKTNATYSRKDDNKWPHGPLNYLKQFYQGATEFEAQHLPLNKRNSQEIAIGPMIKGNKYRWLVKSSMTSNNKVVSLPNIDANFVYGMSSPLLLSPKNKTQYAAEGNITLKWKAGTKPKNSYPPFKGIANIKKNNVKEQLIGEVNEVWVMQLSTTKDFKKNDLINCKSGKIHYDPEIGNAYDETELENTVYPKLDFIAKNLTENTYYWRVVYLKDISKYSSIQNKNIIELQPNEFYISSPVYEFEISKDNGNNTLAKCGNCELEDIDDTYGSYPVDLAVAKTYSDISVGGFEITNIKDLKGSKNAGFTGKGEVKIPFLNDIKIKVNFKNIKINSRRKIFSGIVEAVSSTKDCFDIAKSAWDKIKLVKDLIKGGGSAHDIPIGIDYKISGVDLKVGITKIKFTAGKNGNKPTIKAVMDIMTYVEVPGYTNGWINMAASDICFNQTGVGSEFLLHPYNDIDLTMGGTGGYRLLIKGFKNKTIQEIKQNSSYLEFDCKGWKSFSVKADVEFSRDHIVPDSIDGIPGKNKVKGHLSLQFDKNTKDPNGSTFKNWIAKVNIDPFQITDLEGWGFVVKDAYFDNSDVVNPPNISFPQGYTHPALGNPSTENTWGGFYLKDIGIKISKELSSSRPELSLVHDFIIDKSGKVTTFIGVTNLIDEKTGDLGGWAFSLDKLGLQIIKNELTSSNLEGKLGLPLTHKDEYLKYSALLQKNNKSNKYEFVFNVKPQDKLHFELFVAMATIGKNSVFTIKVANTTTVKATLHGSLMIGNENAKKKNKIPGFKLPEVKFDLAYDNKNGFTQHDFSYASPQKSVQGFPITIEKIGFDGDLKNAKLKITPKLSLAGDAKAFSAAARLLFEAKIDIGEKNFSLDKVTLDSIGIDSKFSGFTMKGSLNWYDENKNQNKGIKGDLDVKIPIGVEVKLAGEFGTHKEGTNPVFGTKEYFSYWYIDGLVSFGNGIPIASGVDLMALGGGFGYNMKLDNEKYYKYNNLSQSMSDLSKAPPKSNTKATKSKSAYIPAYKNYICKFSAKLGKKPTYEVFASLTVSFNTEGGSLGLNTIEFYGNAIFLPEDKQSVSLGKNYIAAEAKIKYDNETEIFDAEFDVYANFAGGAIKGIDDSKSGNGAFQHRVVKAKFHFEPEKWFVNIGTYKNRAGLSVGLPGVASVGVRFTSYLMFGYDIPTYLPALPQKIQDVLGNTSKSNEGEGNELEGATTSDKREDRSGFAQQYKNGTGIAFGASAELNYSLDAGIVYAHLWAALGFDINITHSLDRLCDNANEPYVVGKDGWYGQGDVYTGLGGNLGVRVWFFKTYEIDILSLSAAVALSGGFPNPSWFDGRAGVKYSVLGGLVSGHANFQLRIGDKCKIVSPNPFGLTFIENIEPIGTDVSVMTDIKTTFSLPINKIYEIPVDKSDGKNGKKELRKIAPVLYSYKIFEKKTKKELSGIDIFGNENTEVRKQLPEYLKQHTEYVVEVKIKGRECKDSYCDASDMDSWPYVLENGSKTKIYEEIKRDTFKTGAYPKTLDDFVDYSRPIRNQNFFTSDDAVNKHGLLYYRGKDNNKSMSTDMYNFYFPTKNKKNKPYYYLATFIPQESNHSSIEIPISHKSIGMKYLEYIRNTKLDPDILYECRIQRLIESESIIKMDLANANKKLTGQYNKTDLKISAEQYTDKSKVVKANLANLNDNTAVSGMNSKMNIAAIDNNMNIPIPDYEKYYYDRYILYKYKFRTSKYSTLSDKINSLTIQYSHDITGGCTYDQYYQHPQSCDGIDYEDVEIDLKGDEGFDVYDLFGDSISIFKNSSNSPYDVMKYTGDEWKLVYFDANKLKSIKYPPNILLSDPNSHTDPSGNDVKTNNSDKILNYRILSGHFDTKKVLYYIERNNNSSNQSQRRGNNRFNRDRTNDNNYNNNEFGVGTNSTRTVLKLNYKPVHNSSIILNPVNGVHQQAGQYQGETEALNNYPGYYPIGFSSLNENFKPDKNLIDIYSNIPVDNTNPSNLSYPIYRKFMDKPYKSSGIMPVWNADEEYTSRKNMEDKFKDVSQVGATGVTGPGAGLGVGGGIFTGGGFGGNGLIGGTGGGIFGQMSGAMGGMH